MNYKIRLVVGFRRDQEHSVNADEAHKAYYLFLHPDERGVFSNGLAIKGDQIQEIIPDYQGTMGWNPTHVLDGDDWNELHQRGIPEKLQKFLSVGKDIAQLGKLSDLSIPLRELVATKYPALDKSKSDLREGQVKSIGDLAGNFKNPNEP